MSPERSIFTQNRHSRQGVRIQAIARQGAGNSKNSNLPFETKKALLFSKSLLKLNQELASQSEWNETSIEARASGLFEIAIRVWPSVHSHDGVQS